MTLWIILLKLHGSFILGLISICKYLYSFLTIGGIIALCSQYLIVSCPNPLCSEDFGLEIARRILNKYRSDIACFNDDIQGTGCITLAAIMSGPHVSNVKLANMRTVIFGSGTAGIGIADQLRDAIGIKAQKSKEEASKQIWSVKCQPNLIIGESHMIF